MNPVDEFTDLMPHLIKVTAQDGHGDYGDVIEGADSLTYRCLVDDATTTVRNASGEEVTVALSVYVWPVPVESVTGEPVDIEGSSKIEILSPRPQTRTLVSVERHYYAENGEGTLHNITLRFT